jgi:hypothetical protein
MILPTVDSETGLTLASLQALVRAGVIVVLSTPR